MLKKIALGLSLIVTGTMSQGQGLENTFSIHDLSGLKAYTSAGLHGGDLHVGEQLPVFKLETPEGKIFMNENTKGKFLLLDFWATWCAPCRQLTAEIDSSLRKFQAREDFQMIGVLYREDVVKKKTDPQGYWKEHGYGFPMTLNNNEFGQAVNAANPTVLLIDQEGVIRGRWDAWTSSTAAEITAFTEIALETKTISRKDIDQATEKGEFHKALLLTDKYQYELQQVSNELIKAKIDLLLKMNNIGEAKKLLKLTTLLSSNLTGLAEVFELADATNQQTSNSLYERLLAYYKIKDDDIFLYTGVAKKLYAMGHRELAIQALQDGLSLIKKSEKRDDMLETILQNQMEQYKK